MFREMASDVVVVDDISIVQYFKGDLNKVEKSYFDHVLDHGIETLYKLHK